MEKFFYRVIEGDCIAGLALRFGIPQTVIIRDNNLSRDIAAGDILLIRKSSGKTYCAQPFDTIESVAKRFGVDAETLASVNGVDYLFYGLNLIIPESVP